MTHPFHAIDVFGFWIEVFLTFCILSYLYKDNPFYKFAEHLFVGTSIGYIISQQYYNTLRPNLLDHLAGDSWYWYLIPLALVLMLLTKAFSRKLAWIGRYPLAFVVALYAGIQVNAVAQSDLAEQIKVSIAPLAVKKVDLTTAPAEEMATLPGFSPSLAARVVQARADGGGPRSFADLPALATPMQQDDLREARGDVQGLDAQANFGGDQRYWFGIFSRLLLLIGLCASLVYFYFSIEQKGAVGRVARFGVWVLMIGFGASFGYTVQGRLSLAVGRALSVLDRDKAPEQAAQIHGPWVALASIGIIIAGLIYWERWQKTNPPRRPGAGGSAPPPGGSSTSGDDDLPAY